MGEMLTELDQVDIEKMAMYFASQSAPMREAPPFGDPVAGEADSAILRQVPWRPRHQPQADGTQPGCTGTCLPG